MIIWRTSETHPLVVQATNALNSKEIQHESYDFYSDEHFTETTDTDLYLLDLEADGSFQAEFSPSKFAEQLVARKLPSSITTISLLVSDVSSKKSLRVIAADLNFSLQEKFFRDITVKVISDLNFPITLIKPPESPTKEWQIFGFRAKDAFALRSLSNNNLTTYCAREEKAPIWKGNNINEWLDRDSSKFSNVMKIEGNAYPSFMKPQ